MCMNNVRLPGQIIPITEAKIKHDNINTNIYIQNLKITIVKETPLTEGGDFRGFPKWSQLFIVVKIKLFREINTRAEKVFLVLLYPCNQ